VRARTKRLQEATEQEGSDTSESRNANFIGLGHLLNSIDHDEQIEFSDFSGQGAV